jgi:hypothetical protein
MALGKSGAGRGVPYGKKYAHRYYRVYYCRGQGGIQKDRYSGKRENGCQHTQQLKDAFHA